MKDFTQFSQELMETAYSAVHAMNGVRMDGITDKGGIVDHHQTWKPKELRRINAYINSILRGQTLDPDSCIVDLRMRLSVIGLNFKDFKTDDDEGRVIVPVSQYKGRGWDSKDGEVEEFNNFRPENELYLVFDWWENENSMTQMTAKLVAGSEVEDYMDESMEEGLEEEANLEEGCKKGLKEEDGVCPECGKEECECGESEDGEDDDEEELEEAAKIPKGWDAYEYKIGSHYLPTLINGDSTGLSDEEERDFDKWLDGLDMPKGGHWDYDEDERDEFGKDAVSGLRGDVTLVRYLFKTDKKKVNEECELNESGWKGKRKTPYQPYDKNKAADNKSTKELQAELKKFEEHWAEIKEDPKYEKAAGKFYTDHIAFLKMKIAERIGKKNVNEEAVLDITGGDNNPERLANLKLIAGEVEEGLANLFPYYKVEVRENLGDSVYIVVSTQKKEQWANGIMENSPLIKAFVHSSTRRYDPQKSKLEFDPFMQPRAAKMRKRTETDASKLADYIIAQFKKAALNLKSVNEETDTEELKYLKPRTHKTNT